MASTSANTANNVQTESRPGPGRGEGNGRGRGRARGRANRNQQEPAARPTHFIALPIGHHAGLRTALSGLSSALIAASPPIPGLDTSIVIPPRRAHLTLGVMALPDGPAIARALDMLQTLRPRVAAMLNGRQLEVGLECVDVMRLEQDGGAHVMFAGPDMASAEARRLWDVANMIQREFIQSGLMPDERRPLKLHCTLLNTVYRRPRPRAGRIPFSYTDVLASAALPTPVPPLVELDVVAQTTETATRAFGPVEVVTQTEAEAADTTSRRPQNTQPVRVDLGAWPLDEVQLCEMGSWGPEGEYVAVGAVPLG